MHAYATLAAHSSMLAPLAAPWFTPVFFQYPPGTCCRHLAPAPPPLLPPRAAAAAVAVVFLGHRWLAGSGVGGGGGGGVGTVTGSHGGGVGGAVHVSLTLVRRTKPAP